MRFLDGACGKEPGKGILVSDNEEISHRSSFTHPEALEPGQRCRVSIAMNHIAQRFPSGHRLRLSVSTVYWSLAWPPPAPVCLGVYRLDDIDLEIEGRSTETYTFQAGDYGSLRGETRRMRRFKRGGWERRTWTRTLFTSSENAFRIRADLEAYEGESRLLSLSWDESIRRDHI